MKKWILIVTFILGSGLLAACGNTSNNQDEEPSNNSSENEQSVTEESNQSLTAFYFTANKGGISKIDATTNKAIETIDIEGTVHNVQVSPNRKILGATVVPDSGGHGSHDGGNGEKTNGIALFYDIETDQLIENVEVGSHPAHIVFTENMKYALVTNNEDNNVSVIDLASYTTVKNITAGEGPHGFRISLDSKFAYIANMGENTISVIDLENFRESKKINVGQNPVTTGVTTDGKTLVTTLNSENSLAIVDLTSNKIDKVPVGEGPAQVYIQSDDKYAFVANQGTTEKPSNSVSKIDLETKKVIATIEVGKGAHGIVVSEDNQFVYVTNMYDHTVSVIDNKENKVISTINVGKEPNGITIR